MSVSDLIAVAIVAGCLFLVGRGVWRWYHGRGACGCSHCPLTEEAERKRRH